ncbi:hypothetical protein SAMN06265219_11082 [Gracilimonas mengyeensis]|uniref:Uncharacterized protein n=1 Tax=Gracilimonas mengyeensis TaxID=1302730 RepID=A0A521E1U1_9BACT|nr:hypothetical protein SAMN06265219_11082 [Gracilimonas mengyeensis]
MKTKTKKFFQGCLLGIAFFALLLIGEGSPLFMEKPASFFLGITFGILLFGYGAVKFPREFWKAWFPKRNTQQ